METVSIRKKVNETIIIQNSKRVFKHLFTIIIGMYCLLNFLSIKIDINLSYKFFSIWLFLVLFFAVRPALKRRGIKVFLKVNNQKIIIKKQKIFGKDEEGNYILKKKANISLILSLLILFFLIFKGLKRMEKMEYLFNIEYIGTNIVAFFIFLLFFIIFQHTAIQSHIVPICR